MSKTTFELNKAIFVYTNNEKTYLEHRRVKVKDGTYHFAEGIPFSLEDYNNLVNAIPKNDDISSFNFYGLQNTNLLYFALENKNINLSWICVGNQRELKFDKQSEIKSGKYWIPNLLFEVYNNSLFVYAIKRNRINKETKLYNAPFPNINNNGYVCEGNIKINKELTNINNLIKEWEKFFFNSEFTHLSNTKISISKISNVYDFLLNKAIKYPNNELVYNNKAKKLLKWMK